jgi:type IV pilus assembly protein PilA
MLHKLRQRAEDEKGFTLIELLVVVLIIGILAAIALPTFLGQRSKAQDASAKSNARNMVTQMESCYANTQDYSVCTQAYLTSNEQVPAAAFGTAPTTTALSGLAAATYTITSTSASGNSFVITRAVDGTVTRTCTTGGKGACPASGTW